MKYLIFNMVGWVVVLLVIFVFKPWKQKELSLCDTCDHLNEKRSNYDVLLGNKYRFKCETKGSFDHPPKICRHYLLKEDDESTVSLS